MLGITRTHLRKKKFEFFFELSKNKADFFKKQALNASPLLLAEWLSVWDSLSLRVTANANRQTK